MREMSGTAPFDVQVDDEQLGFYHFSGFDSGAINVMAEKNAGGNKTVEALVNWYTNRTASTKDDPLSAVPWHYGRFNDGSPIAAASRLIYRQRLDLQRSYPEPFVTTGGGYKAWWEKRGRVEFKKLFDPKESAAEMARIRNVLTPGFQAGGNAEEVSLSLLAGQIGKALTNSNHRALVTRRAWEILRTEGLPGIKRRLLKS